MTYQARFKQPQEHLNPLKVRMDAVVIIEVFPIGKRPVRWRARYLDDKGRPTANGVIVWESKAAIEAPQAGIVKQQIARLFEEQLSSWVEVTTEEEKRAARMA